MMDFLNERNKRPVKKSSLSDLLSDRHPLCLGDGIDHCGYYTKIDCEDCKYNNNKYGRKDPAAKCNAAK